MPLKVVWFSTSSKQPTVQHPGDLAAHRFLMALRGRPIQAEAQIPVAGEHRLLGPSNADDAADWFGEMVAAYLHRQSIEPPLLFVPIPGPLITLKSSAGPWTSILTMSIVTKLEGDVESVDVLRWKEEWKEDPSASAATLYDNLTLIRKVEWTKPVILVGYLTSGPGVIQAAAARLSENGARILHVLYAGRIVSQPAWDPFAVMRAEIAPIAF